MDIIVQSIEKSREIKKLFNIPQNNEVVSAVIMGYPKFKYRRGIVRELEHVEWIHEG